MSPRAFIWQNIAQKYFACVGAPHVKPSLSGRFAYAEGLASLDAFRLMDAFSMVNAV